MTYMFVAWFAYYILEILNPNNVMEAWNINIMPYAFIPLICAFVIPLVIRTKKDIELLARLMRAEAESDGDMGMLLVGNVCVNRILANCHDFKNINTIPSMVYQSPGGFEAVQFDYFYQRARDNEIRLAKRVINGERFEPATTALWFYDPFQPSCPAQFWGQWNSGRYGDHCFYIPLESEHCYD